MCFFSRSQCSIRAVAYLFAAVVLILFLCSTALGAGSNAQENHKLRTGDPAVISDILQSGGDLIADYGSFQLFSVDEKTAARLSKAQKTENVSHHNKIELNAGPLDTTTEEVKALRISVAAGSAKNLHLIHFAGPIKPEWRDQLEQTGVKIVSYIPQNAYLIYGS